MKYCVSLIVIIIGLMLWGLTNKYYVSWADQRGRTLMSISLFLGEENNVISLSQLVRKEPIVRELLVNCYGEDYLDKIEVTQELGSLVIRETKFMRTGVCVTGKASFSLKTGLSWEAKK